MIETLLAWLRGDPPPPPCDPLRELIEEAHASQQDAYATINQRRRQRQEIAITTPPSWEDLMGIDERSDGP